MSPMAQLGLVRILFFWLAYWQLAAHDYFLLWGGVPAEFWYPNGVMEFFSRPPLSQDILMSLFTIWRWTFFPLIFGLGYRFIAPVNFVLGFIIVSFAHSFGYQTHTYMPVILVTLPLSLSPASDALSLDRLIRKNSFILKPEVHERTLFNMKLVFCLVFFAAGTSKVINGGWEWVAGDTLRNYFLNASLVYSDINFRANDLAINILLYNWPILCKVFAGLAITIECSTLLILWKERLGVLIVPALFIMQVAIYFTIFVNFSSYISLYIVWIVTLTSTLLKGLRSEAI